MAEDSASTTKTVLKWLLEGVSVVGIFTFLGFVIDSAFQDLLGVEKVSYFSVPHLLLLIGKMTFDTAAMSFAWAASHPILTVVVLSALLGAGLPIGIWAARHAGGLKTRNVILAFTLLGAAAVADLVYFDIPFLNFNQLMGVRARPDRQFGTGYMSQRTQELWRSFICAHRDEKTALTQCSSSPAFYRSRLEVEYLGNAALFATLLAASIFLYVLHRKGAASTPAAPYLLLGIVLGLHLAALCYEYGKAFQPFRFDRVQVPVGADPNIDMRVGLVLSESDKYIILYNEREGLVEEIATTTKTMLGTADLLASHIAFSNRQRPRPGPKITGGAP